MESDVDAAALGRAIQRRREGRQWTTYRLAQRAGVSNVYLRDIEAGRTKRIGVGIVARVAMALGLSTDDLLADIGVVPSRPESVPGDVASLYADLDTHHRQALVSIGRTLRDLQAQYTAEPADPYSDESIGIIPTEPKAAHAEPDEEERERRRRDQEQE